MSTLAKKSLRVGIRAILWLVAILGCVITAGAVTDLYMILVGGAHPGDVIYLDELAPTAYQASIELVRGVCFIAVAALAPSIARFLWRRFRNDETPTWI